jgi:hypothetical protein
MLSREPYGGDVPVEFDESPLSHGIGCRPWSAVFPMMPFRAATWLRSFCTGRGSFPSKLTLPHSFRAPSYPSPSPARCSPYSASPWAPGISCAKPAHPCSTAPADKLHPNKTKSGNSRPIPNSPRFWASNRLSGNNPQKMRFCPDRRQPGSYIRGLVSVAFIRIAGPP